MQGVWTAWTEIALFTEQLGERSIRIEMSHLVLQAYYIDILHELRFSGAEHVEKPT